MKRFFTASIASLLSAAAHAQAAPEPAVEPNTLATVIFLGVFVVFCIGFAWMVWRNKGGEKKE
jgi:hydrogenase/urease accessory protein HupE